MSNLVEFKKLIDPKLYTSVFVSDPKISDSNVYVNRAFSSALHQLFILRNWHTLNTKITSEELWLLLKLHEYRPSKLVFDSVTGNLIAESRSQELYKTFYYNSLWSRDTETRQHFSVGILLFVIIFLVIFYYIVSVVQGQVSSLHNFLDILDLSTREQQWK